MKRWFIFSRLKISNNGVVGSIDSNEMINVLSNTPCITRRFEINLIRCKIAEFSLKITRNLRYLEHQVLNPYIMNTRQNDLQAARN